MPFDDVPRATFPSASTLKALESYTELPDDAADLQRRQQRNARAAFGDEVLATYGDVARLPGQEGGVDEGRMAVWAPVQGAIADSAFRDEPNAPYPAFVPDVDKDGAAVAVSQASLYEHLTMHFRNRGQPGGESTTQLRTLALGAAAAAKVVQLPHMAAVARLQAASEGGALCPAEQTTSADSTLSTFVFVTRPVRRCLDAAGRDTALFPCDAGLGTYRFDRKSRATVMETAAATPVDLPTARAEGPSKTTQPRPPRVHDARCPLMQRRPI